MPYLQAHGDYSGCPNMISKDNKRARRKYKNNSQNNPNKRNSKQNKLQLPKNDKECDNCMYIYNL